MKFSIIQKDQRIECFNYNSKKQIVSSVIYDLTKRPKQKESDYTYYYEDSLITKIHESVFNHSYMISYYKNTNNIDTIRVTNSKGKLHRIQIFEYDTMNNVYKNFKFPRFGYANTLHLYSANNIITSQSHTPILRDTSCGFKLYEYNSEKFPTKVTSYSKNSGWVVTTSYFYKNCK
ncbi:MAG: hypothetical protein HOP11_08910 [Saprospiraceae bacterium]|nr:hypothetical protein [Saprospiraceae bacterium]